MADAETKVWRKIGGSISNFVQTLQSLYSLAEQIGLKPWLGAVVLGGLYTGAAWFWSHVPWYVAGLIFLGFVGLCLWVYHRILLIRATSKFDARKYRQFGRQLVELSQEIFRFLSDRARDRADDHRRRPQDPGNMQSWQEDRDFEQITGRLFFERFGPRVLGSLALLRQLGVTLPPHSVTLAGLGLTGLPQFVAAIGHLLSEGHIKQAIDVSNDADFMWQIGH